jgi:hypothetical protein
MRTALRWSGCLLSVALTVIGASAARAETLPFAFTVPTLGGGSAGAWTIDDQAGSGKRASEPLGFDGIGPRLAVRGALRHGVTLIAHAGLDPLDRAGAPAPGTRRTLDEGTDRRRSTQQLELLKDVASVRGVGLALGVGARREWQGPTVLVGRVAVGHSFARSSVFGNVRFERALGERRDGVDVVTSVGWLRRVGSAVHVGAEAVGEDLEGFWEAEEAEGGAKLFAGPSIHLSPAGRPWSASLVGGPIVYATQTGRASGAARSLGANGNRYAVRLSLAYSF